MDTALLVESPTISSPTLPPVIRTERGKKMLKEPAPIRAYRGIFWDRISLLKWMGAELGTFGSGMFGPKELFFVNSAEYVREILVEQADKFQKGKEFGIHTRPLLGNGLLLSEGDVHRRQRKLVAPAFVHKRVADYSEVMVAYTEQAANTWTDGSTIDVSSEMMRITLAITGKTLFDADVSSDAEGIKANLTYLMHYAEAQLRNPWAIPFSWKTPRNARVRRAIAHLDAIIYRMIAERRASHSDRGDLLSMLLLARDEDDGSGMSDAQVRDEAMTIFLAGHETTANASAWMWYLLAKNPASYRKLQAEADEVLQGRTPAFEDLPRLPFAMKVFKETMRLYPPAYILVRQAKEDVWIDGNKIPKGGSLIISPYLLHRDKRFFPDPEKFDPERFTPEFERELPRQAYMPFGAGPRVCIGNQFALMEGQLIAATLAQRVTFEPVSEREVGLEPLMTLRPKGPIQVRVRKR
jgi:cytochrome P450